MPTAPPNPTPANDFQREAGIALTRLRDAIAPLVAAVVTPARRAADVTRAFDVDAKLGWQLHRIATTQDVFEIAPDIPGPSAVRRTLEAASARRVSDAVIGEARSAFDAFESMVERHAGDRRAFESLLARCAGHAAQAKVETANRRALFRANAQLLGLQTRAQFGCAILYPGRSRGMIDQVMIRGFVDLAWFRPSGSFILTRWHSNKGDTPAEQVRRAPLEPEDHARCGGPLLARFTTDPAPRLRTREIVPGHTVVEILGRHVGRQSAQTYVLGETMRDIVVPPERDLVQDMVAFVRAPAETLLLDLLVHRDHFGPLSAENELLADTSGESFLALDPWSARETAIRLPASDAAALSGPAANHLHTADVPHYQDILTHACERIGFGIEAFDLHRFRLPFPPLHACVLTRLARRNAAPDRPTAV